MQTPRPPPGAAPCRFDLLVCLDSGIQAAVLKEVSAARPTQPATYVRRICCLTDFLMYCSDEALLQSGAASIHVHAGATVLVRGCEWQNDGGGAPQVLLDAGVSKAIVTENIIKGAANIVNNGAKFTPVIANNVAG